MNLFYEDISRICSCIDFAVHHADESPEEKEKLCKLLELFQKEEKALSKILKTPIPYVNITSSL